MYTHRLVLPHRLLTEAIDGLRAVADSGATDDELLSVLTLCEGMSRQLDALAVTTIATLARRGTFAERGYRTPAAALSDLLGWERFEARRRVTAAEQVRPRTGLDGTVLPARLAATASAFDAGQIGLRHVEVIAKLLGSAAADRLSPSVWAGAETELGAKATVYPPSELLAYGTALIDMLDQDGAEPDDRPPAPVNELHLTRHPDAPGGSLTGCFDDAALFDAIAIILDAKAAPIGADDDRPVAQRYAEALADVCGFVLDHGDVPACGGRRPHVNVLIRLEDLEARARAAMLDFGGTLTAESLRMLACDAAVVPIVMDGVGQPLDVGRATRTIPDGLRRAVAARDLGCAFPGCNRAPSWAEVHHILAWEHGGETKLANLVMACRAHHRLLHYSEWVVRIRDGLPEFIPPAWIDVTRQPRRKALPHLLAPPGSDPAAARRASSAA